MTWTPEVSTVNQRVQVGAESTSALGTIVAASKLLQCFDWQFGIDADVMYYGATGRKYDSVQEENTEWVAGTVKGPLDYNGMIYLLASAMGNVGPVAHGTSATAKDWIFIPPVSGSIVPRTYTVEQGDSIRARRFAYVLLNDFGYKATRKDATLSGKTFSQPIIDAITMTSSPTGIALAPVATKHFNVYLDSTSANLGVTQLTRPLAIDYNFNNIYGMLYVLSRANLGFTAHVDLKPKSIFKLKMEADATGMSLLSNLQVGSTVYPRVQAQGLVIDNNQTATITGGPTGGTFTLTYKGQTTATIAFNAASSAVQTAFLALSTVGAGNATVTGSAGGPYTIAFAGTLALDTTAVTASGAGLTGGSSPTITITQTQVYNVFQHDMACKVGKPTQFADDSGVYAIEWELTVVEDSTWNSGQAQSLTLTNLLTAL